ncbi:toll/interleukin-1 receptor domain-containing protein [Methanococcus maripaludis]|uniref:TIR domain-containing protein n=1 Tax=Methanococcus maripaludis TaxID=39152 RepID=A0A2L1C996_METMI|nr:toll/interleukin-1 receptor domain-containing protein [Methanococcus maripaludis]AVB75917.1 hypothetical protein MMJJ_05000 [Methanococcus maripaludis]
MFTLHNSVINTAIIVFEKMRKKDINAYFSKKSYQHDLRIEGTGGSNASLFESWISQFPPEIQLECLNELMQKYGPDDDQGLGELLESETIQYSKYLSKNESGLNNNKNEKLDFGGVTMATNKKKKIFISHSSKDKEYAKLLRDVLENAGLTHDQIFCTSLTGHRNEFGKNFLDNIKNKLNDDYLILFLLSRNFYESPMCMCELGAAWVKTKESVPVLIPPFDYDDMNMTIKHTEGFKINEKDRIHEFKDYLDSNFNNKPIPVSIWNERTEKTFSDIIKLIEKDSKNAKKSSKKTTAKKTSDKKSKNSENKTSKSKTAKKPTNARKTSTTKKSDDPFNINISTDSSISGILGGNSKKLF